jgi:hypothetical protein
MSSLTGPELAKLTKYLAARHDEILRVLSDAPGPDNADLEHLAENAIEQWEEADLENVRLQFLLRDYHDICEELLDICVLQTSSPS